MFLGVAQIHAQKHLGKVSCIVTTGTRTNCDDSRALVKLTIQQGLNFKLCHDCSQTRKLGLGFCLHRRILFGVCHLDQNIYVVEPAGQICDLVDECLLVA